MSRGGSAGGGQSSLGYLFGGSEPPKPAVARATPAPPAPAAPAPVAPAAPAPVAPAASAPAVPTASAPAEKAAHAKADVSKQIPAGIQGSQTNNYHRVDGQMGVLTCAKIHSIELDPDEGGATRMSGGISMITLPAGYIGSCFIGACLIACGFDTNASKVACIVLAVFFLVTLWWARKNWLTWVLIAGMTGLIVLFWFVAGGVALRYFVLFVGVMNCMYALWDIIDDTIARKVNTSDAAVFAKQFGCCPAQVWGVIWLLIAFVFFACGVLVGIAAFKDTAAEQATASKTFLPVPSV